MDLVLLAVAFLLVAVVFLLAVAAVALAAPADYSADPPPADYSAEDLVIVTSHFREDLGWLAQSPWKVVLCDKRGARPTALKADRRYVVPNLGMEASSYLKFIVDYYDRLPARVAFLHGHEEAWHQRLGIPLLEAIGKADPGRDYVSLNGVLFARDAGTELEGVRPVATLARLWDEHFRPYIGTDPPRMLKHDCCAQFVVTRAAIRRRPREAYQRWLALALDPRFHRKEIGWLFEYFWHVVFGEPAVLEGGLGAYQARCFGEGALPAPADEEVK